MQRQTLPPEEKSSIIDYWTRNCLDQDSLTPLPHAPKGFHKILAARKYGDIWRKRTQATKESSDESIIMEKDEEWYEFLNEFLGHWMLLCVVLWCASIEKNSPNRSVYLYLLQFSFAYLCTNTICMVIKCAHFTRKYTKRQVEVICLPITLFIGVGVVYYIA